MRRPLILAAAFTFFLVARAAHADAFGLDILVDGRPVSVYGHDGRSYIEALKGRPYEIRLTNRTGGRIAVALSVDGLNVIDAKHTSAHDAQKWVLGPWESIVLPGWQTSSGTARRFFFTTEERSYGSWLGRTDDLGVISAAFFRERPHFEPQPMREIEKKQKDAPCERDAAGGSAREMAAPPSAKSDALAATGIGGQVDHQVRSIEFDEEDSPTSVVSLRYEYRDALVRLGVIPKSDDSLARRERAHGFSDAGFAPDPYRGR
ncbi:MAG TPA: hypothetical protein VFV19_01155 [Candidatus Polarisedimenticolaceae bacterium]|nr:hypothetical protein [Candidatus Polarisedimenticolaceae bacterium]